MYILKNAQILENNEFIHTDLLVKADLVQEVSPHIQVDAELIDLEGRVVLPGLIDSHIHTHNWAVREMMLPISKTRSIQEMLELIDAYMRELPQDTLLVYLSAWDEKQFEEKRRPTKAELDSVSYGIPLLTSRIDGHQGLVNTALLEQLDWQSWYEKDPFYLEVDYKGEPTGFIKEKFYDDVLKMQGEESVEETYEKMQFALKSLSQLGISAVGSNDTEWDNDKFWNALEAVYEDDGLLPDYYGQVIVWSLEGFYEFKNLQDRFKDHPKIHITHIKLFKDGSLGSRTAEMDEVYDDADSKGTGILSKQYLLDCFNLAEDLEIGLMIHAIGDRAMLDVIDAYVEHSHSSGDNPLRHTIVHAQLHNDDILESLAKSGLNATTQPLFIGSDWELAGSRIGYRREDSYQFKQMSELGVMQGFSSDAPVESANPFETIAAAMNHPLGKEYSFTFAEAVQHHTENNAYLLGAEDEIGKIANGYKANLLVIDEKDTAKLNDPELVKNLSIYQNIYNGEILP